MNFVIHYFDERGLVESRPFTGSMEAAEVIAGSGIILNKAVRATINDARTGKELKVVVL